MIPQLTAEQLRAFPSRGEARFYEACRDQLDANIVVIYSANWIYRDVRGRLNEGEADFTILIPQHGVLAVEVKGGGVTYNAATGVWTSIDRNGISHIIKDPFKQASKERHALIDQILGSSSWQYAGITRLLVGHAVMTPDIVDAFPLVGSDRPIDLIGTNSDVQNLTVWVEKVIRFWKEPSDGALTAKGIRIIEDILCKSIDVRPVLRSTVDDAEHQRICLTANQAKVFRTIGGRRRAVVAGGAGTGKTVLAVNRARTLAQEGLKVLLLCYNRPLADNLANALQDEPLVDARSFHQLCDNRIKQAIGKGHDLLKQAISSYPGTTERHRFDVQIPHAMALSADVLDEKYDAIIVDEAQDFSDEYWLGLELLLRNVENGFFYIFIDENQVLYPRKSNLPIQDEPFYLINNCRNTAPIHESGYCFYRGSIIDAPELVGVEVLWSSVNKDDAQADAIAKRIHQWIHIEGLRPDEITVLVAKKPKSSAYDLLRNRSVQAGAGLVFETHGQSGLVLVDTVARFKGLESNAVILWVSDEAVGEEAWETLYVGTTRAKTLLEVIASTESIKTLRSTKL